jgi:hypothetical protein
MNPLPQAFPTLAFRGLPPKCRITSAFLEQFNKEKQGIEGTIDAVTCVARTFRRAQRLRLQVGTKRPAPAASRTHARCRNATRQINSLMQESQTAFSPEDLDSACGGFGLTSGGPRSGQATALGSAESAVPAPRRDIRQARRLRQARAVGRTERCAALSCARGPAHALASDASREGRQPAACRRALPPAPPRQARSCWTT